MHTRLVQSTAYTTKEAADKIGVNESTMRRWRNADPPQGPAFVQVSKRKFKYFEVDIEAYLQTNRNDPSEAAE